MKTLNILVLILLLPLIIAGCNGSYSGDGGIDANLSTNTTSSIVPCDLDENEQCIEIPLPCTEPEVYGNAGWYNHSCNEETIQIPNDRSVYAFLVNGFDQNHNLDKFHFYNFARCIFRLTENHDKKAYVHFAWWNNLLAPYMKKPLHNDESVPSMQLGALNALPDYFGFIYDPNGFGVPTKAIPAEDYQFQKDAKAVLEAIRDSNPDAAIILVGHSMGGDAVVRLADSLPEDFRIDLLAPIDPVGNRTCLPNTHMANPVTMAWHNTQCYGAHTFTRFRATHDDYYFWPYRISFENNNIGYLYHRWQNEALFPLDWGCPYGDEPCPIWGSLNIIPYDYMFDWLDVVNIFWPIPADEVQLPDRYLFRHNDPRVTGINQNSTNVQETVPMNDESGFDVFPYDSNFGGDTDGHGEIVGFRGLNPDNILQSWPLALAAQNWPGGGECPSDKSDAECRVYHLKNWETDSHYLDNKLLAPQKPPKAYCDERGFEYSSDYCTYCMVSGDLCTLLQTEVHLQPSAHAGPDQNIECSGPEGTPLTLDGSGSFNPNEDLLFYTWTGPFGTITGEVITVELPLGTHTITLTVEDGRGKTDSDTVDVTVLDSAPPSLSVSLSPDALWPPNHKLVNIEASIDVYDTCGGSTAVELVSITSSEADNGTGDGDTAGDIRGASYGTDDRAFLLRAERAGSGPGRVYTVTYRAMDALNNEVSVDALVTVPHDHRIGGM